MDARKQTLLAEMAAARVEMEALKHETAAVGLLDVPASPSDAKRFGTGSRAGARGFGAEKASLNLSFFGGRKTKKSPRKKERKKEHQQRRLRAAFDAGTLRRDDF